MTIILSCGHKVEDFDDEIHCSVADHDELGHRAVSYKSLCKQCYAQYEKEGSILYNEGEENKWLGGSQ